MAKLSFRYGSMNSGKTTTLIQVAHNYQESGHQVLIIKPKVDTKGGSKITTRVGLEKEVDHLIAKNDNILDLNLDNLAAILVDEAQFLEPKHVEQLWYISKRFDIAVLCYGLKVSFNSFSFPGSIRLFELADELIELPTLCQCGVKARFIGRKVNGEYQETGELVIIDGTANVEYHPLCGTCYFKKVKKEF